VVPIPFVSSDTHAWIRPYYEAVASRDGFAQLPIPIQFAALVDAIAVDYPAKAAKLREIADLPSQRDVAVVQQRGLQEPGAAGGGTLVRVGRRGPGVAVQTRG
jgi:hypothetical protein